MTIQNAKLLTFALSLHEAFFSCHCEAGGASRRNLSKGNPKSQAPNPKSQTMSKNQTSKIRMQKM
jgi:hypothetical protein